MRRRSLVYFVVASLVFAVALVIATRSARSAEPLGRGEMIARVRAYTAATDASDYDAAKRLLAPDARVWYEKREGAGDPLQPGAGRWTHWDTYFHGKTTRSDWRVEGDSVVATANETNDYYRLLDWRPWPMTFTWWLDDAGRITGFLVQSVRGQGSTGSRLDDAVAWAKEKHPDEIAYLMPKGHIDPTGDRAERWRKLLVEWRRTAGLPEVATSD